MATSARSRSHELYVATFLVGKEEHGTSRFCGKEFRQDDGIHVTAKDITVRVQPITYDAKHGLTRKATADDRHHRFSKTLFGEGECVDIKGPVMLMRVLCCIREPRG